MNIVSRRQPWVNAIGVTVAALIFTLALVVLATMAGAAQRTHRPALPSWERTPCQAEGDVNCYWNAAEMGNGMGHSYFVRQFPGSAGTVCVMYSEPRFAAKYDYCINENVVHHRSQPHRTRHLCASAESTNCFHKRVSREFPAWYAMTVPLTDTHGNDDLGKVVCHFYVRTQRPDNCIATGLFGPQ